MTCQDVTALLPLGRAGYLDRYSISIDLSLLLPHVDEHWLILELEMGSTRLNATQLSCRSTNTTHGNHIIPSAIIILGAPSHIVLSIYS